MSPQPPSARSAIPIFLAATLLLALPGAHAAAAPPTREGYVAALEPICKRNVQANRRIFSGAKREVDTGKLGRAGRRFQRAAAAFGRTIRQLAVVPRPSADRRRLGQWLGLLRAERDLLRGIGRALATGRKGRAESISVDLNRNSNRANNSVLGFGFDYCRIDPSRFRAT